MHTPLSQILLRLAVISQLEVQESEYTKNLTVGPGQFLEVGSKGALDMMLEPSPVQAALNAFLEALPPPYLGAITALMYAGRNGSTAEDEWQSGIKSWDKARQVRAIVEKTPRMEYIDGGVEQAGGRDAANDLPAKFTK